MSGEKRKGTRIEREVARRFRSLGLDARRVPLSGAAGGSHRALAGDVQVRIGPETLVCEVKARKAGAGFATLERWLGSNDLLVLRRNRREPIVALSWQGFERLVAALSEAGPGGD